jgi:Zn-dependent protease
VFRFRLFPRVAAHLLDDPAVSLGSLAGIRLRAHPSVLLTCAIGVTAISQSLGMAIGEEDSLAVALFAVAVTALVLLSLVIREVARIAAGDSDRSEAALTLYLFGVGVRCGATRTPRGEMRSAAAGLVTTLALAAASGAVWMSVLRDPELVYVGTGAALVMMANALVLSVHVFPALPLDGGRALRAALWRVGGDRTRATWLATRNSGWFAIAMIGTGVAVLVSGSGSGIGVVITLTGWFIGEAAYNRSEAARELLVREFYSTPEVSATSPGEPSPSPPVPAAGSDASFGPERAGSRQVRNPATASTTNPGTLASAPKSPPVHVGSASDATSSSADDERRPLTGTE